MRLLTISKWELRRTGLNFGKRTLIFSLVLVVLIGISSFSMSQEGLHINDGLYKVVVTDPGIAQVIRTDDKFQVYIANEQEAWELFKTGGFDIMIAGDWIRSHDSEKSISALDALDKAIVKYDEGRLLSYNDLNNTFPVWITVENIRREQVFQPAALQKIPDLDVTPVKTPQEEIIRQTPSPVKSHSPSIEQVKETDKTFSIKEQELATPSHFNPPVPFRSVVMSFLFIFPIFFIAQLYSSSIMEERVKRKGELLLASPVRPYEIVIGKLIPYLLIILVLMVAIIVNIGGNAWMLLVLFPVSLMFLSTAFLGAIIARSFKELTFVLIFLSVFLSGYIFFPAMFANIHAISIISPMTLVVRLLEGEAFSTGEYVFSTAPFYLVSLLVFMFGIFIYREEDLFTQKGIKSKLIDSIQVFTELVPAPLFFLSIALLPIVYSIQLMLIVLMFNIPVKMGIVIFILMAAFIEEIVKSAGIYTVFSRKISLLTTRNAFTAGILSGVGFFVGEKVLLLLVISGIAGSVFGSVMGIGLLIFPLLLHVTSTITASLGMRYLGTGNYLFSVLLATIIHSCYNLYLVRGVLSG